MKAYIFNYTIAAIILSGMFITIFAIILAAICFLTWSLPASVLYLPLLRAAIFMGFFTAIFYVQSHEGKQGLRTVKAIWK